MGPITEAPGILYDGPFNTNYANNMECGRTIEAPEGYRIFLTFLEFCTEDYADALSVYDGPDDSFPALVSDKSGCSEPIGDDDILSNGTRLYIYFSSDSSVTLSGFAIQWTFIPGRFPTVTPRGFRCYLDLSQFFISS